MHKKKNFKRPTLQQVKTIHFLILKNQGQKHLELPKSKNSIVQSILDGMDQYVYGKDLYPKICDKGIYLLTNLESAQAFPDGNKRVALAVFEIFLKMNNSKLVNVSQKKKEKFVMSIAIHTISKEDSIKCCIKGLKG